MAGPGSKHSMACHEPAAACCNLQSGLLDCILAASQELSRIAAAIGSQQVDTGRGEAAAQAEDLRQQLAQMEKVKSTMGALMVGSWQG